MQKRRSKEKDGKGSKKDRFYGCSEYSTRLRPAPSTRITSQR